MESEKTIFFALGLVTFIAVASLVLIFQNGEKTANLIYSSRASIPGRAQKGFSLDRWEYVENLQGDDSYRRQEIYPRHRYVQPGTYEYGLKGNYNSGRFGGVVPGNTFRQYSSD